GQLGAGPHPAQREQIIQPGDAEAPGPLEQVVEQLPGRQGVIKGTVSGPIGQSEAVSQGCEFAVGNLLSHEPSSQCTGVDEVMTEAGVVPTSDCFLQEGEVEP